ncbi:MAG: biotin/lipoyl-binding protein [Armatimonadetes bacterium]|nr:biotin/lipoyl-binding protein [Armatimonadota bacterium]CUU34645.1 acetyl-CoA carboxylase biotin carboxyl carrier protein [Armatimonadetes bacterium DC]
MNEWLEQVEQLAQLMAQRGLTRLEIEIDDARVQLRRPPTPTTPHDTETMPPLFMTAFPAEASPANEPEESRWTPPAVLEVRSPLVGYCTLAPIEVGKRVERGETLATIEVLGIPNEVSAPVPGILQEWAVENGQPVEYGQVIARLQPLSEE